MTSLTPQLGLFALIVYGVGDILGAGIYALVGEVIDISGSNAWLTFLFAAILAIITGLSYAELTSRYPVSAGAAAFVRRAFPGRFTATLIGVIVLGTGLVSASTVTVAFSNYLETLLKDIVYVPSCIGQLFLLAGISFIGFWGIKESSRLNFLLTFCEASGLLFVIMVGIWLSTTESINTFLQNARADFQMSAILAGVTVSFYAYIGFEDLANLAEECKNPSRDLPRAILIAISITTVVYVLVTLALLINVPESVIRGSDTPLLLIFPKAGMDWILGSFSLVAILAITNTGLINLIMASRLLYGMSNESLIPQVFGKVHVKRKTPWVGVLTSFLVVLLLVYTGGLKVLAQTTSLLILIVFFMVHVSLIRVKRKGYEHTGIQFPIIFPILGIALSVVTAFQFQDYEIWLRSLLLIGAGLFVWGLQKIFCLVRGQP
jgi:APA family basic amino acid/polyamine antiporter